MDRFLYITPYFPPSSRIGAKRALNLVRHLPELGWEPIVLCCPERVGAEQLGQEGLVPGATIVHRAFGSPLGRTLRGPGDRVESLPRIQTTEREQPSRERSLIDRIRKSDLTPIDSYMWDIPHVTKHASQIAREARVRAIVANADPWSGLIVGVRVARRLGLPIIADFRDPWALHPRRQPLRPWLTRQLVSMIERRFLRHVDRLVLNTEQCLAAYRDHYASQIEPERMSFIRNAFDPGLYHAPLESEPTGAFALHYFGTVGSGRDPSDFYHGFARFTRELALGPEAARIVFHGDAGPAADPLVRELGLRDYIEVRPPSLLRDSVNALHGASALLLLEGPERSLQLPAKLYDYLAAARPVLAVGAHAELAGILAKTGVGVCTRCDEGAEAVAQRLRELYLERDAHREFDAGAVAEFTAAAQARRFRDLLDDVTTGAPG